MTLRHANVSAAPVPAPDAAPLSCRAGCAGGPDREGFSRWGRAQPAARGPEAPCRCHRWCRPGQGSPLRFTNSRVAPSEQRTNRRSRPCRAAVPAGGRRSKPSPRFFAVGVTPSRPAARGGAGVKPPPGELAGVPFPAAPSNPTAFRRALAGGRRSKPSPRFFAVGVTPSRPAARGGAGVNTGVPDH